MKAKHFSYIKEIGIHLKEIWLLDADEAYDVSLCKNLNSLTVS